MNSKGFLFFFVVSLVTHFASGEDYDLVIYGGTPSGLAAAITASREMPGLSVAIVEPTRWIGGVVTGGLSRTDKGNSKTIGGFALEYFEAAKVRGGEGTPLWYAEPRVNLETFQEMLSVFPEDKLLVLTERVLTGIKKSGSKIESITLNDGTVLAGQLFIDASYEGDLMAASGVSYTVGRESRDTFEESLGGFHPMPIRPFGKEIMGGVCSCLGGTAPHFIHGTPTKIKATDDAGKLLFGVTKPNPNLKPGDGDNLTQAYNFRICVTQRKDIHVPFPKPEGYDSNRYELLLRLIKSYPEVPFGRLVHLGQIANGKYDLNAQGLFSTDYTGGNTHYPDGDYETRAAIWQDHINYVQGFLWFLGHDERLPQSLRDEVNSWGLCRDEFVDNNHWPYALYVREARRMKGEYIMSQKDTWTEIIKEDSVGMGSFLLDCHIVQRIVTPEGLVTDEGSFSDTPTRPYQIPYRSLLPKRDQCKNLLVTVCLSASHIAYCSMRMEPVYMTMGHAAGISASMALQSGKGFHEVPVELLQKRLVEQKAVLELKGMKDLIMSDNLSGIGVDDRNAVFTGNWSHSGYGNPVDGTASHDGNVGKGEKTATFTVDLPESGKYEVRLAYAYAANRASAVPIEIQHAEGTSQVVVDQRKLPEYDELFTTLGTFEFLKGNPAIVTVKTTGTDSYVSVDALQLLPIKE